MHCFTSSQNFSNFSTLPQTWENRSLFLVTFYANIWDGTVESVKYALTSCTARNLNECSLFVIVPWHKSSHTLQWRCSPVSPLSRTQASLLTFLVSSLYTLEVKPLHHHFFKCWYAWNGQGLVCCVLIKSLSCEYLKNWLRAKSCSATISSKGTIDKVKDKYYCHCHDPGPTPHQKRKGQ